jgi:hypothetical protein
MFRAPLCPSSGATTTAVAASGLPSELGDSSAVGCGRADHDQQHCCHQAPTVNQKLILQLFWLLMMAMRMTETCWAVCKRQVLKLRSCCTLFVDSVESHLLSTKVDDYRLRATVLIQKTITVICQLVADNFCNSANSALGNCVCGLDLTSCRQPPCVQRNEFPCSHIRIKNWQPGWLAAFPGLIFLFIRLDLNVNWMIWKWP